MFQRSTCQHIPPLSAPFRRLVGQESNRLAYLLLWNKIVLDKFVQTSLPSHRTPRILTAKVPGNVIARARTRNSFLRVSLRFHETSNKASGDNPYFLNEASFTCALQTASSGPILAKTSAGSAGNTFESL